MLANQIRPTTLFVAIVFSVHPFLAKKHRELPFWAIALLKFTASPSVRAARTHNNHTTTGCYNQAPAMNWDLAVNWGRGSGLALAIALGLGWPTVIGTPTKGQNQPTAYYHAYYHQAPAMIWSAGVVGSGLTLAIDAAARVRHTHKARPQGTMTKRQP